MLTQKQLKIFQVFARQPFAELERKQIKQQAKEKSNNALALALKQFRKEEIIKEEKTGKSYRILLNHENDLTYYYIALANAEKTDKNVEHTIKIIKEEIKKITTFYSFIIFGSYAIQKQKKTSDLDIAILIENEDKRKQIEAALNNAKQKTLLNIDTHVITKKEFTEMLTNEEENLGKQIARKHLVLYNHQIFYETIKEGIKHGFII